MAEIDRLTRENLMLQAKVAGFHLLEQNLLESKQLVEIESCRFERMKKFVRSAMQPIPVRDVATLICESIVDILECEIGVFWCFHCGRGVDSVFTSGDPQLDEDSWPQLRNFLDSYMAPTGCTGTPDGQIPPPILDIGEFLVRRVSSDVGECLGIMFSANTNRNMGLYGRLNVAAAKPFAMFAEQVGAVMESRRRRTVILDEAKKLRVSEQRLTLALENCNVGIWDWNMADCTVHYSSQWKRQLGYQDDEVSNSFEEWKSRLHPDDRQIAMDKIERCSRSPGSSFELTLRLKHRGGEWRWIISNGICFADPGGRPTQMIGTHIDITSIKEIENRLRLAEAKQRRAKEHAIRANLAKSDFLAKISHDMRTPLNGVLSVFQMLQACKLSSKVRKLVEMGNISGKWMLGIIGDSLDLVQIEAGRINLDLREFNLLPVLEVLKESCAYTAARKKIEIRWKQQSGLPNHCLGDRSRIKQVVANLIDNAIKFTPEGGRVAVIVSGIPSSEGSNSLIRFRVIDTGPGLSSENITQIFEPFFQLSRRSPNHVQGMGLGLAIVRELVELMGGTIKVASRIGRGSVFSVTLPLGSARDAALPAPPEAMPWKRKFTGKVLFAEDDPISRELGVMVLEKLGLEVTAVVDGVEALAKFGEQRFDLAILDCWMPRLGGIEVASHIRASELGGPATPILGFTANAEVTNVDACIAAGMNACIFKPVIVENLEEMLARFLPECLPNPEPSKEAHFLARDPT